MNGSIVLPFMVSIQKALPLYKWMYCKAGRLKETNYPFFMQKFQKLLNTTICISPDVDNSDGSYKRVCAIAIENRNLSGLLSFYYFNESIPTPAIGVVVCSPV